MLDASCVSMTKAFFPVVIPQEESYSEKKFFSCCHSIAGGIL